MGLKDKSDAAASMAGSWPGDSSSPPSPATFLTVNANIKRNPSLKKLLKLPIFGGGGGGGNFLVNILNCYLPTCFYLRILYEGDGMSKDGSSLTLSFFDNDDSELRLGSETFVLR